MSPFRQDDMADTLHVVEMRKVLLDREFSGHIENTGAFGINRRHIVIGNQNNFFRIPHANTQLLQDRLNPARAAGVVDHRKINGACNDFTGRNGIAAGGMRDNLLGNCLIHDSSLLSRRRTVQQGHLPSDGNQVAIGGNKTISATTSSAHAINGTAAMQISPNLVPGGATPCITNNSSPNGGVVKLISIASSMMTANQISFMSGAIPKSIP